MVRVPRKVSFFGGAASVLVVAAFVAGISQGVMGQEASPEPTPLLPGASKPGTHVYQGSTVELEYPEDWLQQVGDFGSFERYGVVLTSPGGTEVFINLSTKRIQVIEANPVDAKELAFLLNTGIRFKDAASGE